MEGDIEFFGYCWKGEIDPTMGKKRQGRSFTPGKLKRGSKLGTSDNGGGQRINHLVFLVLMGVDPLGLPYRCPRIAIKISTTFQKSLSRIELLPLIHEREQGRCQGKTPKKLFNFKLLFDSSLFLVPNHCLDWSQ